MSDKVVLVEFTWSRDKDPRVPLGHASIITSLRLAGVEAVSRVYPVNLARLEPLRIAQEIVDASQGADIAIGAYVWAEDLIQAVLKEVRRIGFRGRIILGGPQVSYSGAGLERIYPGVDAFVRGYAEEALGHLVHSPTGTPLVGVHWAGQADRKLQAEVQLDALPSPWLEGDIPVAKQRFIRWETQRGCPFRCSFCQHREADARLKRRGLDEGRVAAEIDLFCSAGVEDIAVLDPIFNSTAHATEVLGRFAERRYAGRLSLQCRAEMIDDAFIEAASGLNVTLELGLQTIHADEGNAVKRKNEMVRVERALAQIRAAGIDHEVSLIFGLPLQTLASFEASVEWCLNREVPVIKAFPLLLLRGTPLEAEAARWGLETTGDAMGRVIASNSFDREDWHAMARISEALSATERGHGQSLNALRERSARLLPDLNRWRPESVEVAA